MEKKVKIAHFSDLHITGKDDRRQLLNLDRLLDHLVSGGYDHIVMTGDLIDKANPEDWRLIRDALQRHGLFDWQKVTLTAGNHDLINLEEEMRFYNALNPRDSDRMKRLRMRIRIFCDIFQQLITGEANRTACLPFIKVLNYPALSLAFVVLNSVLPWSGSDNPLGARGHVSRKELAELTERSVMETLKNTFVIGMCHHAYKVYGTDALIDQAFDWTMELKNRDEFLHVMKILKAKMVMHGHFHRFQAYSAGDLMFFNGGSFKLSPERYSEVEIASDGSWHQQFMTIRK